MNVSAGVTSATRAAAAESLPAIADDGRVPWRRHPKTRPQSHPLQTPCAPECKLTTSVCGLGAASTLSLGRRWARSRRVGVSRKQIRSVVVLFTFFGSFGSFASGGGSGRLKPGAPAQSSGPLPVGCVSTTLVVVVRDGHHGTTRACRCWWRAHCAMHRS